MAAGSACSEAVELFESCESSQWRSTLDSYDEVVRLLSSQKKRSKGESLLALDKWFQKGLPAAIASRSKPHLTHEELCKLMKWKLTVKYMCMQWNLIRTPLGGESVLIVIEVSRFQGLQIRLFWDSKV
jgi:hypothetical protein